jgi:hypothetical protein
LEKVKDTKMVTHRTKRTIPQNQNTKKNQKPKAKKKRIGRKLKRYKMGSSNKRKVHLKALIL